MKIEDLDNACAELTRAKGVKQVLNLDDIRRGLADLLADASETCGPLPDEIAELQALIADAEGSGHDHPAYIRDDYWYDFARQEAASIGPTGGWPYDCIDWEKAAAQLQVDYRQISVFGDTYWVRS